MTKLTHEVSASESVNTTPAKNGPMTKLTGFFTELMRKYLPDPFVFAIAQV